MVAYSADRAKQFLSFDALKGLQDELRKKELEYEDENNFKEESLMEVETKLEWGD